MAEALVRALERIYRERDLDLTVECPPAARFLRREAGPGGDARQPARQRLQVGVLARRAQGCRGGAAALCRTACCDIRVDDDGPGLTPEQRAARHHARPPPRRDQARLRPRPLHRRRTRAILPRLLRAGAGPARRPQRPPRTAGRVSGVAQAGNVNRPDPPSRHTLPAETISGHHEAFLVRAAIGCRKQCLL